MTTKSWAVIVASGKEEMLNSETCTAFLNLHSRPVLSYSLNAFEHCPDIDGVIIVAPKDRLEQVGSIVQLFGCHKVKKIVPGGSSQFVSFTNGMKYADEDVNIVLMHESSRPLVSSQNISDLIKAAKKDDYAILGTVVEDETAVVSGRATIADKILDGVSIWSMGSPIAVKMDLLNNANAALKKKKKSVKKLSEAIALVHSKPRLVQAGVYPTKIKTIDNLRYLDKVSISA